MANPDFTVPLPPPPVFLDDGPGDSPPPPPTPTNNPAAVALKKLQDARAAGYDALSASISADRIRQVMDALHELAIGRPPSGDDKGFTPSVPAAKLYLQYALGSAQDLGGTVDSALPMISQEDYSRLEKIAKRFGKNLRRVKIVESISQGEQEDAPPRQQEEQHS